MHATQEISTLFQWMMNTVGVSRTLASDSLVPTQPSTATIVACSTNTLLQATIAAVEDWERG